MAAVHASRRSPVASAVRLIEMPGRDAPPDAWDLIVGVPMEDWRRATTVTELEWLTHLRDYPLPRACDEPAGPDDVEIYIPGRGVVDVIRGARRG